jgi:hypothetical protein
MGRHGLLKEIAWLESLVEWARDVSWWQRRKQLQADLEALDKEASDGLGS